MVTRTQGSRALGTALLTAALAVLAGCASADGGGIRVTGSATVAPITQAVATQGGFAVDVAAEGTTIGFESFCRGESAVNGASTPIPGQGAMVDFVQLCADNGVDFLELPIGLDALSVIRNEENTFATDISIEELRAIWEPGSAVTTWADVRSDWPDEPIGLYGRGEGSGTFEVFTRVVNGEVGQIRDDYRSTDDLEELAAWIADDEYGLGFMGVGNYLAADEENRDRITNTAVEGVSPSLESVQSGEYDLLTRPLFIYVAIDALEDETAAEFVEYYLAEVEQILPRVFFYGLPSEAYPLVQERLDTRISGTMYGNDPDAQSNVLELLEMR